MKKKHLKILFLSFLLLFCVACNEKEIESNKLVIEGINKFDSGNIKEAIQNYDDAIKIWDENYNAYINRADAKRKLKDIDGAILDYNKCIELHPTFSGYYSRGKLKIMKSDVDGAISDFNESIEIDPLNDDAFCSRGIVYGLKEEYEKSITDFDKAIQLNPKNADAYFNRGFSKIFLYDKEGACADMYEAAQLGNVDAQKQYKLNCEEENF